MVKISRMDKAKNGSISIHQFHQFLVYSIHFHSIPSISYNWNGQNHFNHSKWEWSKWPSHKFFPIWNYTSSIVFFTFTQKCRLKKFLKKIVEELNCIIFDRVCSLVKVWIWVCGMKEVFNEKKKGLHRRKNLKEN